VHGVCQFYLATPRLVVWVEPKLCEGAVVDDGVHRVPCARAAEFGEMMEMLHRVGVCDLGSHYVCRVAAMSPELGFLEGGSRARGFVSVPQLIENVLVRGRVKMHAKAISGNCNDGALDHLMTRFLRQQVRGNNFRTFVVGGRLA
jgi:hypothetical protein